MAAEQHKGYVLRTNAPLRREVLAALLSAHLDGAAGIVRRPDWMEMIRLTYATVESILERWSEGQFFNKAAEVRWKKSANRFEALWLTEQMDSLEGFSQIEGSPFTAVPPSDNQSHGFLLWGIPRDDYSREYWMEARIPRPLHYPGFSATTRRHPPRLAYRLYRNRETIRWVRLVEFTEVDDE